MVTCVEIKKPLSGGEKRYSCGLVFREPGFCVLKYVLDRPARVGSLDLKTGTKTYGFYWTDRPYTLYKWFSPANTEVGNYFNAADQISISRTEVEWRDLILDILVLPAGTVEVLDEEELAAVADEKMRLRIEYRRRIILRTYREVMQSTSLMLIELLASA